MRGAGDDQQPPPDEGVVDVAYVGRLGNQLAGHCLGRIIAEGLGFRLRADSVPGFPGTAGFAGAPATARAEQSLRGRHRFDLAAILAEPRPRRVSLRGPYLRYEYYRAHKQAIRSSWLRADGPSHFGFAPDDLTIHIRAGDLWARGDAPAHPEYHALPFSFYRQVIEERPWARVLVVCEEPDDPMACKLRDRFGATILSGAPLEDFARLRASQNVVLSVSSFSWWAAWLSDARRVYYPIAGLFDPARARRRRWAWQQDLWVDDEPRYVAVRPVHPLMECDWRGDEDARGALLEG